MNLSGSIGGVWPKIAQEKGYESMNELVTLCYYWSRLPDSNRGPPDYKSGALPTELKRLYQIKDSSGAKKEQQKWCSCGRNRTFGTASPPFHLRCDAGLVPVFACAMNALHVPSIHVARNRYTTNHTGYGRGFRNRSRPRSPVVGFRLPRCSYGASAGDGSLGGRALRRQRSFHVEGDGRDLRD